MTLAIYSLRIVALDNLREAFHPRGTPSLSLAETVERLGDDLTSPLVVGEGSDFALSDLDYEDHWRSKVHRSTVQWPGGKSLTIWPSAYQSH